MFPVYCVVQGALVFVSVVGAITAFYAAVVACIAQKFGVPYKVYAGFCIQKSSARYERDKTDWESKRASGVKHPFFATHVYTEANGMIYEYFNGDFSNIDHLDVVEIAGV